MSIKKYTYFVAFVLPEPILSQVEQHKQLIAEKFGSKACLKAPAHITLIPPFWFTDDKRVIQALQSFRYHNIIRIQLNGYGSFGKKVLYIKPEPNEQLTKIYHAIKQHFIELLDIADTKKKRNLPFVPHVTIGNRDWTEAQFEAAKKYFIQHVPFKAECALSAISLLKFEAGRWHELSTLNLLSTR